MNDLGVREFILRMEEGMTDLKEGVCAILHGHAGEMVCNHNLETILTQIGNEIYRQAGENIRIKVKVDYATD